MKTLRRVLALLIAFSLTATPIAARIAMATQAHAKAGMSTAVSKPAAMPDCHGAKARTADKKAPAHKHCPECDKNRSCSADLCQLKCFKVIGALVSGPIGETPAGQVFAALTKTEKPPLEIAPQPPPPRT